MGIYSPFYPTRAAMAVTIAKGASLSTPLDLRGHGAPLGVVFPAAWDAAELSFQVSLDGEYWANLYELGSEMTVPGTAGGAEPLNPATFVAWRYLRLRSGTAGAPVAQTAARALVLCIAPVVGG